MDRHADAAASRQTDIHTYLQINRHTDRQTHRKDRKTGSCASKTVSFAAC
jgi:hypothetical protein